MKTTNTIINGLKLAVLSSLLIYTVQIHQANLERNRELRKSNIIAVKQLAKTCAMYRMVAEWKTGVMDVENNIEY